MLGIVGIVFTAGVILWLIRLTFKAMDCVDDWCVMARNVLHTSKQNPHITIRQFYDNLDDYIDKNGYTHIF